MSEPLPAEHRTVPGAEAAAPILDARGVVKTYQTGALEVPALRGIDLTVEAGEMVAVVGPSGCGKTTLLNCLSGLDDIDAGEVRIDGRVIHEMPDRARTDFRGRSMGFVFQAFNLIPVFSAAENVELPLLLTGVAPREARRLAESVLDLVGLGHRLDHRPAELSGGEQQRVTIARALAPSPSLVWADEPTGNLDSATAEQVMDLLHRLHRDGLTVILVTHDLNIAAAASRLISMRDGVIVDDRPQ
jgi:putative ABC transport system ATP-binding protein